MVKYYLDSQLVEKFMKENNLTKKAFCDLCGISVYILKRMLTNASQVGAFKVYKVAVTMNVKADDLIIREFESKKEEKEYFQRIKKFQQKIKKIRPSGLNGCFGSSNWDRTSDLMSMNHAL